MTIDAFQVGQYIEFLEGPFKGEEALVWRIDDEYLELLRQVPLLALPSSASFGHFLAAESPDTSQLQAKAAAMKLPDFCTAQRVSSEDIGSRGTRRLT